MKMEKISLQEQAESCRRSAHAYIGLPEARFLMEAAKAFDDLADAQEVSRSTPEIKQRMAQAA